MRVAVVGAGFAGLATSWHLLSRGFQVTLFDERAVGGGASGVATGLLHPYPGEQARRSVKADEGLAATKQLLQISEGALGHPVASFSGILRFAMNAEQMQNFSERASQYDDIVFQGENRFLITSGITVYAAAYLNGLWKACEALGARLVKKKISSLEELKEYDRIVIAVGAGIRAFKECEPLALRFVKGQLLLCEWPESLPPLERSLVGKGYVARGESPRLCQLGATYEREFTDGLPDLEKTKAELIPKISSFFPLAKELPILECRAGIRVMNAHHYTPLMERLSEKAWVLTGMGSRGLLYHACFAEQLASHIGHLKA